MSWICGGLGPPLTGSGQPNGQPGSAHFSKRFCLTASPEALEARLEQLADPTMRMACINVLDAVVDKVPAALRYLSEATGPVRPFETPPGGSIAHQ